ncbi:MAG: heterodisulfide reductase [Deltaproteobacteria bacterium CG_4_8_14_3_um_filter_45_9]|nr:MAG: heterodisulfide reductase [Deltaproteobacteria bacterium CG03_land_8_20_14_0_80_45_14]PIX24111.1 MAG: heterodisulfide reductase [Deltaproteobacteria bacterium CG_4_8_14_3_um_filter_45_9]
MEQKKTRGDKGSALVIGAGIAGMQSALLLAEMGTKVFLLEQGPAIGGYFPLLDKTFPTNSCGVCFMSPTPPAFCPIYECHLHDNIELLPNSEVMKVEGGGGDFNVSVIRKPRFVDPKRCNLCEACIKVCPVEVEREFGGGLEKRKAIYLPFPQAIPHSLVIDPKTCTRCGECVKVCSPGAIDLDMKEEEEKIEVGAILLGFGFEPFQARRKGEYGFGRYENVLTSIQFERLLSTSSPTQGLPVRVSDGKKMEKIAFIQCVGSRDPSCGQDHCSTICCMYATKQAMIAKERSPGLGVTFFYMDIRPMGKDYERYYERAKKEYGIEYIRSAISSIKELQQTKNLLITYVKEDGTFEEREFDAVVLSLGFTPPQTIKDLAQRMGVQVNQQGFCQTDEFNPSKTSVNGIFVGGAFRGPRDIPETVVEGSSAAASAASFLIPHRLPQPLKEYPIEGALGEEIPKIGVFLCHCGEELKKTLSLFEIILETKLLSEVVHVEEVGLACLPEDLDLIKKRIGEQGLNRIVIAGCSHREIRGAMEEMAKGMGFNPYLIEYANIREQCAFVHLDYPRLATEKAMALIRMAVERAKRSQPIRKGKQKIDKKGLVVGGGLAGMTASLQLAAQGYEVYLIEKEKELGGNLKESFYTLKGSNPQDLLNKLIKQVESNGSVHLYSGAEVLGFEKKNGHYRTKIRHQNEEKSLDHGALILATGGKEITPKGYLYGEDSRVITQRQLEKMAHLNDERLKDVHSVVMIQCVGSRDEEHPYCSRICCSHAVKNALKLKEKDPRINIYVLYRDVRTYGFYETYYHEARGKGVIFIRYDLENKPKVSLQGGSLQVSLLDPAMNSPVTLSADRVVLSAGIEPNDHRELARIFDVDFNSDGFFMEANPKSAPLDSVDRGKFFCGLCHSPNFIEDAISQGNAAAARAGSLLSKEAVEEKAYLAYVIKRLCCGCGLCVTVCPYGARVLNEEEGKAEVIGSLCQGCGSCVIACRNAASQQRNFEKDLNLAALDAVID